MGGKSTKPAKADAPEPVPDPPSLPTYFGFMEKSMEAMKDSNSADIMADPEKMKQVEENKAKMHAECKEWAGKAFDFYDADKSGSLELAEAKTFFPEYIEGFLKFHEKNHVQVVQTELAHPEIATLLEKMSETTPNAKEQAKGFETMLIDAMKAKLAERRTAWEADREGVEEKGFASIDRNGDGKVLREHVIDALTPDTDIYNEMHKALGLIDEESMIAKAGKPGGCCVQ
jgi:Ca2+-binding EF-hand superfamily protein